MQLIPFGINMAKVSTSIVFMIVVVLRPCNALAQGDLSRFSLVDEDAKREFSEELRFVVEDLDLGLRSGLCEFTVSVESAPESLKVFVSTSRQRYIKLDDGVTWNSARWETLVLSDEREPEDRANLLFGDCEFERIVVDGKSYSGEQRKLHRDRKNSNYAIHQCVLFNPFKMPFSHPLCFGTSHECSGGETFFGELYKCVGTCEGNGTRETIWLDQDRKGKSFAFHTVATKNGLPVRMEIFGVLKGFDFNNGFPNRKLCKPVSVVQTEWKDFGGVSVPVTCHGTLQSPNPSAGAEVLHFKASMNYFDSNSKEFIALAKELTPTIKSLSSNAEKSEE